MNALVAVLYFGMHWALRILNCNVVGRTSANLKPRRFILPRVCATLYAYTFEKQLVFSVLQCVTHLFLIVFEFVFFAMCLHANIA